MNPVHLSQQRYEKCRGRFSVGTEKVTKGLLSCRLGLFKDIQSNWYTNGNRIPRPVYQSCPYSPGMDRPSFSDTLLLFLLFPVMMSSSLFHHSFVVYRLSSVSSANRKTCCTKKNVSYLHPRNIFQPRGLKYF